MSTFLFLLIMFIVFLGVLFLIFHNEIFKFLFPEDYVKVEIEEREGNVRILTMKKTKDLSFKFREGIYFLYFPPKKVIEDGVLKAPKFNSKFNLRMGKMSFARYKEGYSFPIVDNLLIESEAEFNLSILEQKVDNLYAEKSGFNDDLLKWVIIGGIIVVVLIVIYVAVFKQPPKVT